jgi:hypothetical protein
MARPWPRRMQRDAWADITTPHGRLLVTMLVRHC